MKRLFIVLSAFLLVLLSSCSNSELPNNKLSDELVDIPETLIVNVDLPQDLPTSASTYKVSYKNFDSNQLLEVFNMNPTSFSERDAIGQRFESGNSILYVYDDDGVLYGGFSYIKDISADATSVIGTYYNSNLTEEKPLDDFSDTKALSFLENIGLEQLKVDRVYEVSGEELNKFIKSSDEFAEQDVGTFNPKDKYSLVYLSQLINDIPFITFEWGVPGETQTDSEAKVIIFENQVIDSRFVNLYDVEQEISNGKIISPESALNTFILDYNKKMQFDTTTITNVSLKYVVTVDKNGMYAQPAYVFEYEYKAKFENSPELVTIRENKVISAINGEFILSSEVGV